MLLSFLAASSLFFSSRAHGKVRPIVRSSYSNSTVSPVLPGPECRTRHADQLTGCNECLVDSVGPVRPIPGHKPIALPWILRNPSRLQRLFSRQGTHRCHQGQCDWRSARYLLHEPRLVALTSPVITCNLNFTTGGPGDSGLRALNETGELLRAQVGGSYDIVSWDPRGVGSLSVYVPPRAAGRGSTD